MGNQFQANKQLFVDFLIHVIVPYTRCLYGFKKRDSNEWAHKLVASGAIYQFDHEKKKILIWGNIGIPHMTSINSTTCWMNTHRAYGYQTHIVPTVTSVWYKTPFA